MAFSKRELPRIALIAFGAALVFGVLGWIGFYYIFHGELAPHEIFQTLAAREAMHGRIPCRDFAYTNMPLLPYLSGIATAATGYGLTDLRAANLIVAGAGLLIIILALRRRLGAIEAGFTATFVVAASPQWVWIQLSGANYAWASLFLAVAFYAAIVEQPLLRRAIVFAVAVSLAIQCELGVALLAAVLTSVLLVEIKGTKQRLITLGVAAAVFVVSLIPVVAVAGPEVIFFNFTYQRESALLRHGMILAVEWWQMSPAVILILITGILGVPALVKRRGISELLLLSAGAVGLVAPMFSQGAYGRYVAPGVPIAAAAGVTALWATGAARIGPFRYVFWVFPAIALLYPLPRVVEDDVNDEVTEAAGAIERLSQKGPVLTPVPLVAVEAGRQVLPGTEQGMFAAMAPEDRALARRLHLTTLADITAAVQRREPAAVVWMRRKGSWNFKLEIPSMRRQQKKLHRRLDKTIRQNYRRVHRTQSMDILARKD